MDASLLLAFSMFLNNLKIILYSIILGFFPEEYKPTILLLSLSFKGSHAV